MKVFVLINSNHDEIKRFKGESVEDTIKNFICSVWQQGYGADQKSHLNYKYHLV